MNDFEMIGQQVQKLKEALEKYETVAKAHGSRLASIGLTSETLDERLLEAKMELSVVIEDWVQLRVWVEAQAHE